MIYVTGDIHGDPRPILNFAEKMNVSRNDIIVILGDVGVNYDQDKRDEIFEAFNIEELVTKIEEGTYRIPTSLSREVVSFLNAMLQ